MGTRFWSLALFTFCFAVSFGRLFDIFFRGPHASRDGLPTYEAASDYHIYFITPTHGTPARELHLLRLASQLALVPNLTWFIVEDDDSVDDLIASRLEAVVSETRSRYDRTSDLDGFSYVYTHLPKRIYHPNDDCRGLDPRFHAVETLFDDINDEKRPHGALMFLDDDNVYAYHMMADLRMTNTIKLWPGANFEDALFNFPVVSGEDGQTIIGMYDTYGGRKFPLDMSNFGINTRFAMSRLPERHPGRRWRPRSCSHGQLETKILEGLGVQKWSDFSVGSFNASRVGFWHTRTAHNALSISRIRTLSQRTNQNSIRHRLGLLLEKILVPLNPNQALQQDIQILH